MSVKVASLYADLGVVDKLNPALKQAKGGLDTTKVSANDLTKALLGQAAGYLTVAGAVGGLIALEKAAIGAAADHESVMVKLDATLASTGRSAEISSKQISDMATSLMGMSTFDDENILSAYTAIAKFENIPTDRMNDLVTSAMDVTAVMGGDLAGNAENIARILETGLVPRSLAFNDALKKQVQEMIAAGDKGGALNLVLGELNKRYGGQAAAELDTYNGRVKQLKNNWGEFLETIGGKNLDASQGVVGTMNKIVVAMTQLEVIGERMVAKGGGMRWYDWIIPPLGAIDTIIRNVKGLNEAIDENSRYAEYDATSLSEMGRAANYASQNVLGLTDAQIAAGEATSTNTKYVSDMEQEYQNLVSTYGQMDARTIAVGQAFGYLDDEMLTTMVNLHNFDLMMEEWGNKPITKDIVLNMWSQATGGWSGGGSYNGGAPVTGQSYVPPTTPAPTTGGNIVGYNPVTQQPIYGNAMGADFIVPSGFNNDNYLMGAKSGEHVQITPAGQSSGPVDLSNRTMDALARRMAAIMQMGAQ